MNNLENIINKIKANSKLKEDILLKEVKEKMENIEKEYNHKLLKEKEIIKNNYETKKVLELERINSSVELKAKKEILNTKGIIVSDIINNLNETLSNISDDEMLKYIERILSKRSLKENEKILLPLKYSSLLEKLSFAKLDNNIKNGFIILSDTALENYTFDSIIKFKYEEIEGLIQKYFN